MRSGCRLAAGFAIGAEVSRPSYTVHLVILNQYYPPDVAPTGLLLRDVAEVLVSRGHEVTIVCSSGAYAGAERGISGHEIQDKNPDSPVHVVRIRSTRFGRGTSLGKVMDYGTFFLRAAWKLYTLHPRPDRIVAMTTPPYLSVLARAVSRFRGADHGHWVMDLYPDVMVSHGMIAKRGVVQRLLAFFTRWGFGGKRCQAVLTLGPDMVKSIGYYLENEKKHDSGGMDGYKSELVPDRVDPGAVSWVPLWATDLPKHDRGEGELAACRLRHERGWKNDEIVVMYSGNMGLGHRFDEMLAAAKEVKSRSGVGVQWRFVFFGGGRRRAEVLDFMMRNPELPMELHGYAPMGILNAHLKSADVHVVSLEAAWTGTMVPSKFQGIFAAGRPVVYVGSAKSSLAAWVNESGGGWFVEPDDVQGFVAALREAGDPRVRKLRGRAAEAFSDRHFDRHTNIRRCAGIFVGGRI